jgi:ferrous iron transport protein A
MNLAELKLGETAIIESIVDHELSTKLFEMGCLPGERVKLKFTAPMGDPIAIQVAGYMLAIRLSEASAIQIRIIS